MKRILLYVQVLCVLQLFVLQLLHAQSDNKADAMLRLGNRYVYGDSSLRKNVDSALACYKTAAAGGQNEAYIYMGWVFEHSGLVPQDFSKAVQYYKQGAEAGNDICKDQLAYFYFKGLGGEQSYSKAAPLFYELAQKGSAHAQCFLGAMYRNGYYFTANSDSAKYWLKKAAMQNYAPAIHELVAEPLAENGSLANPQLEKQLAHLQQYQEQFRASNTNDISGKYTGYAVYRDFSKQYVHKIVALTLDIQRKGNGYEGTWTESETDTKLTTPIKATFNNNTLQFDSSRYIRRDHYSHETPEHYRFDKAQLNIQYFNDSVHLSGDMQFYSLTRGEPGMPMFISLSKAAQKTTATLLSTSLQLFPNPAGNNINATFALKQACKVQMRIADINGRTIQVKTSSLLPAGTYTYAFDLQGMAGGNYVLQIITPYDTQSKVFIKAN